MDLDNLITEARTGGGASLDRMSTPELVELMNREDASVPEIVAEAAPEIAALVDGIVERLEAGGRLVFVGAGTSGRLAAGEAAECEATFSTPVVAFVTDDEDDAEAGATGVAELELTTSDAVVGVSASGRTPFTVAALEAAANAGALTAAVVSAPNSPLARIADAEIAVVVGPEVIAGSTRLKAGTAQKLVLNTISTVAMVRLGKVFGDLMVDVAATNEKLRERARRIVETATGATPGEAEEALSAAGGSAKVAILALLAGIDAEAARARLDAAGGHLRRALDR